MHVKRKLYSKLKKTEQNERTIDVNCCCERPKSLRKNSEAADFSEEAADFGEERIDCSERLKR